MSVKSFLVLNFKDEAFFFFLNSKTIWKYNSWEENDDKWQVNTLCQFIPFYWLWFVSNWWRPHDSNYWTDKWRKQRKKHNADLRNIYDKLQNIFLNDKNWFKGPFPYLFEDFDNGS